MLTRCFVISVLMVTSTLSAKSDVVPMFSYSELLKSSELVASILPIDQSGHCSIIVVYKGDAGLTNSVIKIVPEQAVLVDALRNKKPLCVFLKRDITDLHLFRATNIYYAGFLIRKERPTPIVKGEEGIEEELLNDLSSQDNEIVENAIQWLNDIGSIRGRQQVEYLANSKNPSSAVYAEYLATEVPYGKKDVLQKAFLFIMNGNRNPQLEEHVSKVIYAFEFVRATDDADLLNHKVLEPNSRIALELADTSPFWADKSSVPYLMLELTHLYQQGTKLEGNDQQHVSELILNAEFYCIKAIAKISKKPTPHYQEFMQDPKKSYTVWQSWWEEEGNKRYGNADLSK